MTDRRIWEDRWRGIVDGDDKSIAGSLARSSLNGFSHIYQIAYENRMRKLQREPERSAGAPTISVGNIVLGGTGKTPVCVWVAKKFLDRGLKVGVLTRGYGRAGKQSVFAISGDKTSWAATGDEPQLYLSLKGEIAVAVDPDRHRGAETMMRKFGPDVILMDDGYQFITMRRDWNILLFDAESPVGNGRLFPAGELREPMEEANRADMFWFHRADRANAASLCESIRRFKSIKDSDVVCSKYAPTMLRNPFDGEISELTEIRGKQIVTICGLAKPASFEQTVQSISGIPPTGLRYPDHHAFTMAELGAADKEAVRRGASVATSEKDAVRIPGDFRPKAKWWALIADIEFVEGAEIVEKRIRDFMRKSF